MNFKISKTYSPYSYSIELHYDALELVSSFTINRICSHLTTISEEYLIDKFESLTFIDSRNIVVTTFELIDYKVAESFLMYKSFRLFNSSNVYNLIEINSRFIVNNSENLSNVIDNPLFFSIQSIIDQSNFITSIHKGYIQLINIVNRTIFIKLHGTCSMCELRNTKLIDYLTNKIRVNIKKDFKIVIVPLSSTG